MKTKAWDMLGALSPGGFGIKPPRFKGLDERSIHRIVAGGYFILTITNHTVGLERISALETKLSRNNIILAQAFKGIDDTGRQLSSTLTHQIATSTGRTRAFWLACLGHLGHQARHAAAFVKQYSNDPHPEARIPRDPDVGNAGPQRSHILFSSETRRKSLGSRIGHAYVRAHGNQRQTRGTPAPRDTEGSGRADRQVCPVGSGRLEAGNQRPGATAVIFQNGKTFLRNRSRTFLPPFSF